MKKIHFLLFLLLPTVVFFTNCGKKEGYAISGTIQNAANLQVTLEQAHFQGQPTALGKATCDGSGKFRIERPTPLGEGIYRISIGAKRIFFMLNGNEDGIDIAADLNTLDKMQVEISGSETATCYVKLIQELFAASTSAGGVNTESFKAVAEKGCTPLMKAVLSMQLISGGAMKFLPDFKKISAELSDAMPSSKYSMDYATVLESAEKATMQQAANERIQVGQPAPDITLPGLDGKNRSLSSLKGKIVLLDFWASWCGPCRRENPNVVAAYKKYKEKGFEVFSVSLDGVDPRTAAGATAEQIKTAEEQGRLAWKGAIEADGLIWENHVSDLKKWGSAGAALYGVQSIPKTFLIDRNGVIVALNPRGALEAELLKVL